METPISFTLDSELLQLRAQGWQRGRGSVELAGPAKATFEFTPALAK